MDWNERLSSYQPTIDEFDGAAITHNDVASTRIRDTVFAIASNNTIVTDTNIDRIVAIARTR